MDAKQIERGYNKSTRKKKLENFGLETVSSWVPQRRRTNRIETEHKRNWCRFSEIDFQLNARFGNATTVYTHYRRYCCVEVPVQYVCFCVQLAHKRK